jgi:hypothetical protein
MCENPLECINSEQAFGTEKFQDRREQLTSISPKID